MPVDDAVLLVKKTGVPDVLRVNRRGERDRVLAVDDGVEFSADADDLAVHLVEVSVGLPSGGVAHRLRDAGDLRPESRRGVSSDVRSNRFGRKVHGRFRDIGDIIPVKGDVAPVELCLDGDSMLKVGDSDKVRHAERVDRKTEVRLLLNGAPNWDAEYRSCFFCTGPLAKQSVGEKTERRDGNPVAPRVNGGFHVSGARIELRECHGFLCRDRLPGDPCIVRVRAKRSRSLWEGLVPVDL